jgi:hypothetical protein
MRARHSRQDKDFKDTKSTVKAVAVVLGVYTTLYLAIVAGIQFITSSPDALAAIAPEVQTARAAPGAGPLARFMAERGLAAAEVREPGIDETDNARECTAAIDTECIYN